MLIEQRTYTFATGKVPAFLAAYEARGRALQSDILGHMVGYFTSEFGEQNQIVHLWAYTDLEDRQARRQRLLAVPEWQAFMAEISPWILKQESKILRPTAFSPLR